MNQIGYDAVTVGELELERGDAYVRDLLGGLKSKVVVSNVTSTKGKMPWSETAVFEAGGQRIGVIGLVSRGFGRGEAPLESEGWTVEDPEAALKRVLPGLRKKTDLVVVLAHLAPADLDEMAKAHGGDVDLLVAGHMASLVKSPAEAGVAAVLRSGQRGQQLGIAQLEAGGPGGRLKVGDTDAISLDVSKFPDEPGLARKLISIKDEVEAENRRSELDRELQRSEGIVLGQDRYLGEATCARCHTGAVEELRRDPHSHAFATLEAKGKANDASCLPCHVTGFQAPGGFDGLGTTVDMKNVQCESCHGMGTNHDWSGKMAAATEATCVRCHVSEWSPKWEFGAYMKRLAHGTPRS